MAGTSRRGSSKSASPGQTEPLQGLHFSSLCVDVADKRILWDVTGHSLPGRVLAIMGPSGEPVVGACYRHGRSTGHLPVAVKAVHMLVRVMDLRDMPYKTPSGRGDEICTAGFVNLLVIFPLSELN